MPKQPATKPATKAPAKAPTKAPTKAPAKAPAARDAKAAGAVLGRRALNRALLARQMLLRRHEVSALDAVERLVGLQAQAPSPPYFALAARLEGFRPEALAEPLGDRRAVRITLMRGTIHLVSARDALALRPALAAMLRRGFAAGPAGKRLADVDLDELAKAGRALLDGPPRASAEIGELLRARWPEHDAAALGQAVCFLVPLVQAPPRGLWGQSGRATWTPLDAWLGRACDAAAPADAMLLRYLGAFGPASVNDMQIWSGLGKLREAVERLRPGLRAFRDERGVELFDLPDAPLPDPETPAPPRFLPEFDNVLLSHADRARVIDEARRKSLVTKNGLGPGAVLVDGFVAATWAFERERDATTLHVRPFEALRKADQAALEDEGARLLAFAEPPGGRHAVRFAPAG